ncbi:MAG: DUF5688 family protein, partial [Eubacteriales bacterium]|nr:DUF5688 family protein [Eubacteriales bacterium]
SDSSIVPKIYLEEFYSLYQEGNPLEEIYEAIARVYKTNELNELPFSLNSIFDYETQKYSITTKVISAQDNQELLRNRPSTRLEDMAVVYQIEVGNVQGNKGTIGVTNDIMERWGVPLEELHQMALHNTERMSPARLFTMESFVYREYQNILFNPEEYIPDNENFLVLSNHDLVNGAATIANPYVLRMVSEVVNDSFYIIPSSVHEVLIIPNSTFEQMNMTPANMGEMVREINEAQVSPDERLSDHIYEYDKENQLFKIVEASKEVSMQETPENKFANFKPVQGGRSVQQQDKRPSLSI